ncbi:MFS transporter [Halorussus halophilus]|uniref:MFS transporter n=1 Tax=Halorussus halophilus TaxID=2650975 RepID=UPI00130180D1|nr:MFS transporter [Halorussus halophilus]
MTTATRTPDAVPWGSRTVRVVLASTALAPLGVPLIAPALPVVRDTFGLTVARVSLLVSLYFVTGIVLSPFIGLLADRVGRRRVLVSSLLIFSLAGGAMALASNFGTVLAIRIVQGTAAAGIFITTVTLIGDAFEGVQRNAVLGVNTAVLAAGAAVFPLVGGYLVTFGWNVPFFAYLAGLPVALFAHLRLEESRTERNGGTVSGETGTGGADRATRTGVAVRGSLGYLQRVLRTVATRSAVVPYGTAFLTELLAFGAVFTILPFLFEGTYGLSPLFIGAVITVTEVVSSLVAAANGRLARRFSDAQLITFGYACYGVGMVLAWLTTAVPVIVAGVVVFGAGIGLTMPSVDALLSGLVRQEYRAGAFSLRNSTTFLGRATGPILFAGVATQTGYRPLLLATGVVGFLGVVGSLTLSRTTND